MSVLRSAGRLVAAVALLAGGVPATATGQTTDGRPLLAAARAGDTVALRTLLGTGVAPGATAPDGSTALHWASYRNDLEQARLLVDAGADVDAANDLGATALWTAAEQGSLAMVDLLLAAGADPGRALLSGESPVMVAARSGHAAVIDRLLRAGADPDRRAARGQTALMWAAAAGHAEVVAALLDHRADLAARSDVWSQEMAVPPHSRNHKPIPHGGNTALLFAARAGDVRSARLLLDAGADANDADAWGMSATTLAAHGGHTALVVLLLEHGADPSAAVAGVAPLHNAVMRADASMVRALLARGADPNGRLETWTPTRRSSADLYFPASFVGATPYWLAARFARVDLMRLLADHGADPRFVHEVTYVADGLYDWKTERTTTLMAALGMGGGRVPPWVPYTDTGTAESRTLAAVELAVTLGADLDATDVTGRTALDEAEARQYASVVTFLVGQGATTGEEVAGSAVPAAVQADPGEGAGDGAPPAEIRAVIEGTWELVEWHVGDVVVRPSQMEGRWMVHDGHVMAIRHRNGPDDFESTAGYGEYVWGPMSWTYGYRRSEDLRGPSPDDAALRVTDTPTIPMRRHEIRREGDLLILDGETLRWEYDIPGDTFVLKTAGGARTIRKYRRVR